MRLLSVLKDAVNVCVRPTSGIEVVGVRLLFGEIEISISTIKFLPVLLLYPIANLFVLGVIRKLAPMVTQNPKDQIYLL